MKVCVYMATIFKCCFASWATTVTMPSLIFHFLLWYRAIAVTSMAESTSKSVWQVRNKYRCVILWTYISACREPHTVAIVSHPDPTSPFVAFVSHKTPPFLGFKAYTILPHPINAMSFSTRTVGKLYPPLGQSNFQRVFPFEESIPITFPKEQVNTIDTSLDTYSGGRSLGALSHPDFSFSSGL